MCFFCIKFAVYSLLLWMPLFLEQELHIGKFQVANFLSLFEIGVVFGVIILGILSDCLNSRRSPIIMLFIISASSICFCLTFRYNEMSNLALSIALFFFGFTLGSVQHMINTTCTADLGRQVTGKQATATITGIIDACGNTGAGLGQVFLGAAIETLGWQHGYLMVVAIVIGVSTLPLMPVFKREVGEVLRLRRR